MEENAQMAETVMLVDAAYLDFVIHDLTVNFQKRLRRPLEKVDMRELVTYLALDAGIREGGNEIQVLMIYDEDSANFSHSVPSDVQNDLNNIAFKNILGEFSFYSFQPEQLTTREDLYLESLKLIADTDKVKRLIVLSFNEEYEKQMSGILDSIKGKEVIHFRMDPGRKGICYREEIIAFPVMRALGIKGEELD